MPIERQIFETIGTGAVLTPSTGTWAQRIVKFLKDNPTAAYRSGEISNILGEEKGKGAVFNTLQKLVKNGYVDKKGQYYAITNKGMTEEVVTARLRNYNQAADMLLERAFNGRNMATAEEVLKIAREIEQELEIPPSKNKQVSSIIANLARTGRIQKIFRKV